MGQSSKESEPFLPLLFHLSIRYISSQPSTEESSQLNQERKIEKMKDRRGSCGGEASGSGLWGVDSGVVSAWSRGIPTLRAVTT